MLFLAHLERANPYRAQPQRMDSLLIAACRASKHIDIFVSSSALDVKHNLTRLSRPLNFFGVVTYHNNQHVTEAEITDRPQISDI